MTIAEILDEARSLSIEERKQLMKGLIDLLAEPVSPSPKNHRLRELRGLGKEIWQGIDAQTYIEQQRDEWDRGA
ncbi:MAG: hypothetical protein JNM70_27045 [Anaerolineae bacterium]|nr:hypothetical protein [Anaerolineae bacterium]